MAYNSWFSQNPNPNASFLQRSMWNSHVWGRQQFAKSFARGGIASTMFAPTRKEMLLSPWRFKHKEGSPQYIKNLRKLQQMHPNNPGVNKALAAVEKGSARGVGRALGGAAIGAAMVAMPAFTEDGPIQERARAVTKGLGGWAGFAIGAKAGAGVGAVAGSIVPVVGTAIGAVVGAVAGGLAGSFAGEGLTDYLTRIPDRMVDRERARRGLNWGQHTAAFNTRRAHTMRQQSLALMNRGAMSSRSLLGQEAMYVHR
jgi:hypothetical protein